MSSQPSVLLHPNQPRHSIYPRGPLVEIYAHTGVVDGITIGIVKLELEPRSIGRLPFIQTPFRYFWLMGGVLQVMPPASHSLYVTFEPPHSGWYCIEAWKRHGAVYGNHTCGCSLEYDDFYDEDDHLDIDRCRARQLAQDVAERLWNLCPVEGMTFLDRTRA
ncbi:hypothetical protein GCK72_008518 [Caenorhabditis remanei]|uniref:Uncharacterized protein n=1 Tax=Caenorhabditis remanei TaxID=31234 RepID=A0A6A5H1D3_CAERE|nr:hypothetical protein GCK72_008518 [Caenorhabditis remanei]KAF1760272.1 hypothetical protein GCK72_008518 [Caenorhabditis remanei]